MAKEPWYRRYIPKGTIYLKGRVWWVALPIPGGKRKFISLRTIKKTVAGYAAQREYDAVYGRAEERLEDQNLESVLREFQGHDKNRISDTHSKNRQSCIRRFCQFAQIDIRLNITTEAVNRYLDSRAGEISAKTLRNERVSIGRWCEWLLTRGYIDENPVRASERPHVPEMEIIYLDEGEIKEVLAKAEELGLWAVYISLYAGFRRSELTRMRWEHLSKGTRGRVIHVDGKKGKRSTIPMHAKLPRILAQLKRESKKQKGLIFAKKSTWAWDQMLKPLHKTCPKLAQKGQGWHVFRRTFGSILTQKTGDIATVSKLMRHSSVAITMKHYAHLLPEHGRDKLNML